VLNLFLLLSLFLPPPQSPPKPVQLTVRPQIRMVKDQSRVRVRVEPDTLNRKLTVEWFRFPGFENRKDFQLEAEQAPKFYEFLIKWEEAGDWTVRAIVLRSDESKKVDFVQVMVRGGMEE
jgi:cell division inhibitor SulA